MRYETLLKLFFAENADAETALGHIGSFETKIQDGLPYLQKTVKTLEGLPDEDSAHLYYLLTARFGVKVYETYLEWCKESKAALRGQMKRSNNHG